MHFEDDCMPKQRLWSKLQELQLAICLVSFQHGFHRSIIAVLQILWLQKSYKTAKDRQNRISRNIIWAVQIQWLVGPCGCHKSSAFGIQLDSTIVCWCLLCKFKPGNVVSQNFPALHASQWLHYASQSHRFTDDDLGIVSPYKIQDTHVYLLHQCIFCIGCGRNMFMKAKILAASECCRMRAKSKTGGSQTLGAKARQNYSKGSKNTASFLWPFKWNTAGTLNGLLQALERQEKRCKRKHSKSQECAQQDPTKDKKVTTSQLSVAQNHSSSVNHTCNHSVWSTSWEAMMG